MLRPWSRVSPSEGFNLVLQHLVAGFGVSAVERGSRAAAWHTLAHTSDGSLLRWRREGVCACVWGGACVYVCVVGGCLGGSKAGALTFVSMNTCFDIGRYC